MKISQVSPRKISIVTLFCIAALIVLCLCSCDPSKHIARIIKRHPELVKTDTVWKKDTIVVAGASKDSSFHFYQHDTVLIKKDNMTVKYFFNKDSTVYIQGKCDPKIIYKAYPVQVNSISVKESLSWGEKIKLWIWDNWWWVIGIAYLVWRVFGKALKKYFPFLNLL